LWRRALARDEHLLSPAASIVHVLAPAKVLADPAAFTPLGRAARETIEERYSLEACISPLANFFERVTNERST
jgi:hypothetical protein